MGPSLQAKHASQRRVTADRLEEQRAGGNALDSSAPTQRRGKEKEQPKKKKLSAIRKVSAICKVSALLYETIIVNMHLHS